MPSLKTILLSTILSLAATSMADECPEGWLENTFKVTRCCFGHMKIEDTTAFCCIHDPTVTPTSWDEAGDCFSKVPFTASDYSDQVSAASTEAAALATDAVTVTATTTDTSVEPSVTETASTTGSLAASTSLSSDATSETETPTSNPAMPVATAEGMVLGGAAVVAALFAL